jgi:creatinine amidohydrolase/Fe(II)-dependent formamide hydrolase-like protein
MPCREVNITMARRRSPVQRSRKRLEVGETRPEGSPVGTVRLTAEDLKGIFKMLKSFCTKFPDHAEGLIERVSKMLNATPEEVKAATAIKPRNAWKVPDTMKRATDDAFMNWVLSRDLPEEAAVEPLHRRGHVVGVPPQRPNAKRATSAVAKAAEKVITRVETAIENAAEK